MTPLTNQDPPGRLSLETNTARVKQLLKSNSPYYIYVLCRQNGSPFYVGKGVNNRVFDHALEVRRSERLTHKLNVLRSMDRKGEPVHYCIESSYEDESSAHARERYLISHYGRHDLGEGPLTNQTNGGEGISNPSEESRERRRRTLWGEADDEDRRLVNTFFQKICSVRSVPIKPLGGTFKPERLYANRSHFAMSDRQAAALVVSAIANRVMLSRSARLPRRLTIDGVELAIENGVGRDALSSKMAILVDMVAGYEVFELTEAGYRYVLSSFNSDVLVSAGVVNPD